MPGTGCDLSTKAKGIDRGQREGVAGCGVKMERGFRSSEGSGHQISGEPYPGDPWAAMLPQM